MLDPSSLLDWYHSPSIYIFPDWIIAAGLQMLAPFSPGLMAMTYSGVIAALYVFAFAWFLRIAEICSFANGALYSSVVILAVMCIPLLPGGGIGDAMTMHLATAYIHTGAIAFGLVFLGSTLRLVRERERNLASAPLALSVAVAFFLTYADPIILPWFIAPALAAPTLTSILQKTRPPALQFAVILGSSIAGTLLDRLTRPFPVAAVTGYGSIPSVIADIAYQASISGDKALLSALFISVIMAARGIWLILRGYRHRQISVIETAELLLIACTWSSLLTPVVTGALVDASLLRYALPIFLLPYLWVGTIFAAAVRRYSCVFGVGAAVVLWAVVLTANAHSMLRGLGFYSREPALASCLLSNSLTEGYANYWNAKSQMWLSGYKVHLIQLNDAIEPYRYNFNERWFSTNAATGAPVRPNFIVTQGLNVDAIRATFGNPTSVIECDGKSVWLYPDALPTVAGLDSRQQP